MGVVHGLVVNDDLVVFLRNLVAESQAYRLTRYLKAKRSVDNRALNRRVWSDFLDGLIERHSRAGELTILDLAGGTGNTTVRLLKSLPEKLDGDIRYTLVDVDQRVLDEAARLLPKCAGDQSFQVRKDGDAIGLDRQDATITIELVCSDAFQFMGEKAANSFDCILTQAWLDLVHLETALEQIFRLLCSGGLFYAPIHFDGVTRFLPKLNGTIDEDVECVYHDSMDSRTTPHGPAAGSDTGSRLLTDIPRYGGTIESVGSSDWIVRPNDDNEYPADEEYFLRYLLALVENELASADAVPPQEAREWVESRRSQIDAGALCFLVHQLDVLATV